MFGSGGPEREVVADDVYGGEGTEPSTIIDGTADHAAVWKNNGTTVGAGVRPGGNGWEQGLVGLVIRFGEVGRVTVARAPLSAPCRIERPLENWRQQAGGPGDAGGKSDGASIIGDRNDPSGKETVARRVGTAAAKNQGHRLASVIRK